MRLPPASNIVSQRDTHARKNGRPKTWTGTLLRKLVVLDVFSNFTNDQLLKTLRGSTEGTRSLQTHRKKLLGPGYARWRSRDNVQMHRRISRLHSQLKPGTGPRVFSLDPVTLRKTRNSTEPLLASPTDAHSPIDDQARHERLELRVLNSPEPQNDRAKVQIRISAGDVDDLVETCPAVETTEALSRALLPSSLKYAADDGMTSSIILSYNNLEKYKWLEQDDFCNLLRNRATRLAVNNCRLTTIPHALGSFSRLKYLNLSRNRLRKIPTVHLPEHLTHLDLRHNHINKLPRELLTFNSLRVLAVSCNSITELPCWLSEWDSLQTLYAEGNPLSTCSYSCYYEAYQPCMEESTDRSCKNCISLATRKLKQLLSQSSSRHADAALNTSWRYCDRGLQPRYSDSMISVRNSNTRSRSGSPGVYRHTEDPRLLKSFLQRMSILSEDVQSSISVLTLDSMSSAGTDNTSRLDVQAFLVVRCCNPRRDDPENWCIHLLMTSWISDGEVAQLPPPALTELDIEGNGALHVAASFGASPNALRFCIETGCNPSIINSKGETFLHRVTAQSWDPDDIGVLALLLCLHAREFDFGHPNYRGSTIFHQSTTWILAFQTLFLLPDFPGFDPLRRNAFGKFASEDDSNINIEPWTNRWIWSRCCSHQPLTPETAIRISLRNPDPLGVPVFEAECESNSCNISFLPTHRNPLHAFAGLLSLGYRKFCVGAGMESWDGANTLERILEVGAEVNDYNDDGETTLMVFIRTLGRCQRSLGDAQVERCINLLMAYKANARWYSRSGETALHYAIYHGLPHAIEPLVNAGANPNARNGKGLSVLELLVETMHKMRSKVALFASFQQCMAVLADHGAVLQPSLEKELRWQDCTNALEPKHQSRKALTTSPT